jgi:hypothetical protein
MRTRLRRARQRAARTRERAQRRRRGWAIGRLAVQAGLGGWPLAALYEEFLALARRRPLMHPLREDDEYAHRLYRLGRLAASCGLLAIPEADLEILFEKLVQEWEAQQQADHDPEDAP